MHRWNDPKQKKTHVERESATDAARSDSSGCATVAKRYYKFIDDWHLEAAKLHLSKLGGQLARASQWLSSLECLQRIEFWVPRSSVILSAFTHTQNFTHTHAFTHRHFYTQTLLHTDAFTHRHFYIQSFYTKRLLHTEACTHTERLLHTEAFTCRPFYT